MIKSWLIIQLIKQWLLLPKEMIAIVIIITIISSTVTITTNQILKAISAMHMQVSLMKYHLSYKRIRIFQISISYSSPNSINHLNKWLICQVTIIAVSLVMICHTTKDLSINHNLNRLIPITLNFQMIVVNN